MPVSRLGRSSKPKVFKRRLELEALESRWVPSAIRDLPGFTANTLPANDDGSSPAVNLGFTVNFFGVTHDTAFVNNNGNVTFNVPFGTFTPTALNSDNGGVPIIAPFFADVDTRGAGNVVTYGTDTLCGRAAFGVDYFNVNYFDATAAGHIDKFNTFQVILVDRSDTGPGNFDIEFNYQMIAWETGDASGGTNGLGGNSAAVGYSNGTGIAGTFFELPGSHVPGTFIDGGTNPLNQTEILSTTPGRIHFLVRDGQVVSMQQETNIDFTSNTRVFFPFRFITDLTTGIERGNLTICNIGGVLVPNATDACLDITSSQSVGTINGPINVLFPNLPAGIQLANPTGVTASGIPFITVNVADLPANACLRVQILIRNPNLNAETTFFGAGIQTQVIGGTFDPTLL